MKKDRIAIIGAGGVGAALAMRVLEGGLADVVLLDIYKGIAQGKALDILDSSGITGSSAAIVGTDDYSDIKGARVVVITAGLARKPGMSREELISKNAAIIKEVAANIKTKAPRSIVIVVTNPLDVMTYLTYKTTSFKRTKVLGMAGVLDESRFKMLIARELRIDSSEIKTVIMGSHSDTMVPILSHTKVKDRPLSSLLKRKRIDELVDRTRRRGGEIVDLLGSGSACYSPSLAAYKMLEFILNDQKEVVTASTFLDGEYGLEDLCIGVPVKLGGDGIESIVEIPLAREERDALMKDAAAIRDTIKGIAHRGSFHVRSNL